VRQHLPDRALRDVAGAVYQRLSEARLEAGLRPGARIALTAGSRGISNIDVIVNTALRYFRDGGFNPFIVPAMGSHGGGTAEGQRQVLAHYGISDSVVSSTDVVPLGRTPDGIDVAIDRSAAESDGIVLINRIKWHTTFEAPVESGLMKMAAIGLGKLYGAQEYHRHIVRRGFYEVIRSVGRHVIASGRILGGVGILEDAHHATSEIAVMRADRIEAEETELLARVKSWMAKLPFPEIDILIVDEIGKHIAGVGMDSKVINRHPYGAANPWTWLPRIYRVYVRSLSPKSLGNANGLGMADMISDRLYDAIDWNSTKVNALTANNLPAIRTPLRARSDREALEVLAAAVGRRDPSEVTCVWIRNTLELAEFRATGNLPLDGLEVLGEPVEWAFDDLGSLSLSERLPASSTSTR
jgi:hypothetical protein